MSFEKIIEREIDKVSLQHAPEHQSIICQGWPVAKETIESMAKIVKNPIVSLILMAVSALGTGLVSKFCKTDNGPF